jgi:hypothetical protein
LISVVIMALSRSREGACWHAARADTACRQN